MNIFDEVTISDMSPAQYSEQKFVTLNRSARPEASRIRQELEVWFSHYPISGQMDLRARFRSNDANHSAAFFELFLHELLIRLGCKVTLHPTILGTTTTPDFLVEAPDGSQFYLEATVATRISSEKAAALSRINTVYDLLNRLIDSPNFFVSLDVSGTPHSSPPAKKLARFISENLAKIDPDEINQLYTAQNFDSIPSWQFHHDGWMVDIKPIPKSPDARGKSDLRPLGFFGGELEWVQDDVAIKNAITEKAKRYGDLNLPYVIAVNTLEPIDGIDVMNALFGQEQFTITFSEDIPTILTDQQVSRKKNGAWVGPNGPRNTRVSAILLANMLVPWTITHAPLVIYHNPWAQRKYSSVLTQLSQAVPVEDHIEYIEGQSSSTIFGLPTVWPKKQNEEF